MEIKPMYEINELLYKVDNDSLFVYKILELNYHSVSGISYALILIGCKDIPRDHEWVEEGLLLDGWFTNYDDACECLLQKIEIFQRN